MRNSQNRSVRFIVNNSRLEGLHHTTNEIERIENVVAGKLSINQAINEIISTHNKKYGKHI